MLFRGTLLVDSVFFGIGALVQIGGSNRKLKGWPRALIAILIPLLFLSSFPAIRWAHKLASNKMCASKLHGLYIGLVMYGNDYRGKLPASARWSNLLSERESVGATYFSCDDSEATKGKSGYAMNKYVADANIGQLPKDIVILFETTQGQWNQVGGPEMLTCEHHQGKGCYVLFGDGHVEFVKKEEIPKLRWKP